MNTNMLLGTQMMFSSIEKKVKKNKVRFSVSTLLEKNGKISEVRRGGYLRENAIRKVDRSLIRGKQETRISFTVFEKYVLL